MSYDNYRFTKDHEWVVIKDDIATIGITEFATNELGDVVYVELFEDNKTVSQKDEVGTIESVKTVSSLYSPLSGEFLESNSQVIKDPNIINEDPLNNAWLLKLKPSKPKEFDQLMTLKEYESYTKDL